MFSLACNPLNGSQDSSLGCPSVELALQRGALRLLVLAVIPWWTSLPMYLETHLCVQRRHNTQWWGCWMQGECTFKTEGKHHTTVRKGYSVSHDEWDCCPNILAHDEYHRSKRRKKSIQTAIKYKITRKRLHKSAVAMWKKCDMHLRDPKKPWINESHAMFLGGNLWHDENIHSRGVDILNFL